MKKLMTIFASAATLCAFGAVNAEGLTSTGFETAGYVAGQDLSTTNDDFGVSIDSPLADKVWVPTELEPGAAVVTAYGSEGAAAKGDVTPVAGGDDIGDKYLKLDSAQLISRYAQTGGEAYEIPSEGIYIDTLVKFTVSEDADQQETEAGDKLCIWVNVDSETGATNLMVKAGYISDISGENIAPTSYVTDYSFEGAGIDNWHRLTVKAIAGIDKYEVLDGFVIYIDGVVVGTSTPVMCNDFAETSPLVVANAFPSMIYSGNAGGRTLTSIGFKGSGSIDNVQFTTDDPLPTPEPVTYELTITATGDATNTTYTATTNGTAVATGDLIVDGQEVVVVVTPNNGWEYASTPADWSAGAAAGTITKTFTVSGAALAITIPAPTAKSSGYDSGDGVNTFVIPTAKEELLKAALPSGATTLADKVSATSDLTYAQAYALGLWDENAKEVADLDATITVGADGKVTVTLANAPAEGYRVTCNIYEKESLTAAWPITPTTNYDYGSETAFEPSSATAGFYKVEVVISNASQD